VGKGKLYIVATPIGNLADITQRAVDTLRSVDVIACEDTRHSGKLLKHHGISARLIQYHDHNKDQSAPGIVKMLLEGHDVALITDSGTPGISDPAFVLLRLALADDIEVVAIPGACAAIAALTISGLPMDRFAFEGFLPVRVGKRRTRLLSVKDDPRTQVFYESPHRIVKVLAAMREVFGNRNAAVARELTKLHEEVIRGTLDDILERFGESKPRGEFIIIVEGNAAK
jgi:16S rRNA (cytidine1402-2'-O)-methyltransferase